jgi:GNAT superfamily N-acetyltransferase
VPSTITWRVRQAQPADRAFVLGLVARLAEGFELPPWRTAEEVVRAEAATLGRALDAAEDRARILIAEMPTGERGGFVYLEGQVDYFRNAPHAHVAVLAVAAEAEGQGAGRALLAAAEGWAREHGINVLTLNVFEGNARARGVYERLGFAPETLRYVKTL